MGLYARYVTLPATPLEPLSEAETEQLRSHLSDSSGASLEYTRGVFSALACSPQPIDPPTWLPWVMGPSTPSKTALRESFALLMREAQSIEQCLALGEPWFPATDADVVQFCKGFTRVTQHGSAWRKANEVFLKVLPFAATAGYIDATSLTHIVPEATDLEQWLRDEQCQLRDRVLDIYTALAEARASAKATANTPKSGNVGRNEPCPCGSGKKYKKCCAT